MKKLPLIRVRDGDRTLYFRRLPTPRADGVVATLVGYRRAGATHWY